jgi:hypothetical protein
MKTRSMLLTILAFILAACSNNPVGPVQEQVVLQGYLYAREPVRDIYVASSMAIGGTDSIENPITTASVVLVKSGVRYQLSPNSAQPGYFVYNGNDLVVNTGDDFRIEVDANGQHVTAETIVPQAPEQMFLSTRTLHFQTDSVQRFGGIRTVLNGLDTALVTWANTNGDYFFVVIESIDPNRQLMRPDSLFTRRSISQPTNQASYQVNPNSILYTGQHMLRLYRVNKEYADLYRSRFQDSRTLNEPLTNVQNGLGIFSAFASDSVAFNVIMN